MGNSYSQDTIWNNIYKLIREDRIRCEPKGNRELYPLDYVKTIEKDINILKYPIVYGSKKKYKLMKLNVFKAVLYNNYPFMKDIKYDNMVLAGGAILSCFSNLYAKDLDLFIYGLSLNEAKKKTEYIIDYLESYCKKNKIKYFIIQTKNITQIFMNMYRIEYDKYELVEVQIIPRLYNDIGEILYGFDLGSSSVAFNGEQLYFSLMGAYAYVNNCNIIDTKKCSSSMVRRTEKYSTKGFNTIFPFYKKPNSNYYYGPSNFRFNMREGKLYFNLYRTNFDKMPKSNYDYIDFKTICNANRNSYENMGYYAIISKIMYLNKNEYYLRICDSSKNEIFKYLIKGIKNIAYRYHTEKYMTNKDIISVMKTGTLNSIINTFGKENTCKIIMDNNVDIKKLINQRNEEFKKIINSRIKNDECKDIMNWIIINPGSQISGSFNPIKITEKKFYNKFFDEEKFLKFKSLIV